MGVPDSSLLDLLQKVRSWLTWGTSDMLSTCGEELAMPQNSSSIHCECDGNTTESCNIYRCQSCCHLICAKCGHRYESQLVFEQVDEDCIDYNPQKFKSCNVCHGDSMVAESGRTYFQKVHPSISSRHSPEPPSPYSVNDDLLQKDPFSYYIEARDCGYPTHGQEESDTELGSASCRNEFHSFNQVCSSPLGSPSRNSFTPYRAGHYVQWRQEGSPLARNHGQLDHESMAILKRLDQGSEKLENLKDHSNHASILQNLHVQPTKPLDFENNGLMWYPPPPEDENDDADNNFFSYDDDEDDVGTDANFSATSGLSSVLSGKEKQTEESREPIKAVIQGHFRALVLQLLQGEGIKIGKDDPDGDWLEIVTAIAWQAANFVKPDTSRGGSMDPSDYVKVKCVASGTPSESTLIKGVVCTKNIKHKRMTSQYKNPKLFILGGALEFQKMPSQLASFDTLLEQEHNHLKKVIAKIEALRPNVLLVEKSVSSFAQDYLLAKEISLVLNVKRSVLERIARCTGAHICPSVDNISTSRLGRCELFRLEKISEDHESANQSNKKPSKTLMFFEGCPRRLGCTILLRGKPHEELKKVKHVIQYAVFAAYHLSLETSFLADEGATLPKMEVKQSVTVPDLTKDDEIVSALPSILGPSDLEIIDMFHDKISSENMELGESGALPAYLDHCLNLQASQDFNVKNYISGACSVDLAVEVGADVPFSGELKNMKGVVLTDDIRDLSGSELQETIVAGMRPLDEVDQLQSYERVYEGEASGEYFSATDTNQSILVSFSSRCVLKGTVCERSRLLRIKFYGCFDKPLGRYLRADLFDQTSCCHSCQEPTEAHVICYTHQLGNLTINVRRLSSIKLPGESDGKIWMWHRCLRCAHIDGVPPATRRVVMSDAAWGLSFGKFLELSFSNHATANRIASCGHSLQRDCLRYYGYGSMVAFFRYSPIDIHHVRLPPSVLEFDWDVHQYWIGQETAELVGKMETMYAEIADLLDRIEQKCKSIVYHTSSTSEVHNHILELKDQIPKERDDYRDLLQPISVESSQVVLADLDIFDLNHIRHELLIAAHVWDSQLNSLDSLLKKGAAVQAAEENDSLAHLKEASVKLSMDGAIVYGRQGSISKVSELKQPSGNGFKSELEVLTLPTSEMVVAQDLESASCHQKTEEDLQSNGGYTCSKRLHEGVTSPGSNLSDRIDSIWTGTHLSSKFQQPLEASEGNGVQAGPNWAINEKNSPPHRRLALDMRVHSFDSALRFQERIRKGISPSSLHLSTLRSFHASGDYRSMVRDPTSTVAGVSSETLPLEAQKLNLLLSRIPSLISSAHHIAGGARLLHPRSDNSALVVAVYDDDPTSIVSYVLNSKEYGDWVSNKCDEDVGRWSVSERSEDSTASSLSAWQSFGSLDSYSRYASYGSEDISSSTGSKFSDTKRSPHLTVSFGDDTATAGGRTKFSVTCYFAKQFDSLRKRCCSSEVDLLSSLSRCQKWSAQGGKSNVYFAKTLDERFIIKQVKKTELESFVEFAPEYFKYLTDSLTSGSPTCLAKVLGMYQVSVKHLKSGKETKMDLMIMENLFFGRSISRVYDLKGSARSRYNPDTTGANKVLLDMNLVETLRTEPIFLGSKAKRSLERAIWNDTSFLASVDVMDYSLLVGVDNERQELVVGIIDFLRQYTWDKHLETWVKASGILGGPKNESPTIISPKQYKKRFRKAMTTYFLTLPEQWTS